MAGFYESAASQRGTLDTPLASDALFAFHMEHAPLFEAATGKFVARSGHKGTWSRGTSTLAGVNHASGTYTAPATVPGFDVRTISGASALCLLMGPNDALAFPFAFPFGAMTGWLRFIETGAVVGTNGATIWALSTDDATANQRLFVDTSGTASGYYGVTLHNGSSAATARLSAARPTSGQLVDLVWTVTTGGALTVAQSINGGAFTTASSAGVTPAAWAAGSKLRFARRGATDNPSAGLSLRSAVIWPGAGLTTTQAMGGW